MSKVNRSLEHREGVPRPGVAALRVSLVALLLVTGSIVFSLLANQTTKTLAAPAIGSGFIPVAVSKNWYFAEGRVGGGFREFLTLGNPDPSNDCSAQIQYLPEGTSSTFIARKPLLVKTVSIPHASRYTTLVNADLSISVQHTPALLLSALVTVPNASACAGIVVERPMYFSYHGVLSGSDVIGANNLATNFYFADVPTSAGSTSFMTSYLTVLNPATNSAASATATYYAAGHQVGTQTISVAAGARGTLLPGSLTLPNHVAAIVTVNLPVVVERSSYLYNIQEGIAGLISSASSIIGATQLSNGWLFAEGYTGGQTQENLIISNLASTATTATVTLEYQNGHRQTLTLPVGAYTQAMFDVNSASTHPTGTCDTTPCSTTPQVSAEVSSTSMNLIVDRAMYFHYHHTLPGTHLTVAAIGGTEVSATLIPAIDTVNFAEGYTNTGYNEWLTLQNPTANAEQVTATLLNEYGRSYTQTITIAAKSRATVDITDVVMHHLLRHGDDYRGYQISMSIHAVGANVSFVAERPMYFHTSTNIQGGTDVIGFAGDRPI